MKHKFNRQFKMSRHIRPFQFYWCYKNPICSIIHQFHLLPILLVFLFGNKPKSRSINVISNKIKCWHKLRMLYSQYKTRIIFRSIQKKVREFKFNLSDAMGKCSHCPMFTEKSNDFHCKQFQKSYCRYHLFLLE